jgi:type II restriction enzyme
MALDLANYEAQARDAIRAFWGNREAALRRQRALGNVHAGTRGAVLAGNNLDGFRAMVLALVKANGLAHAEIHTSRSLVVLPGFFRPTKQWDTIVMVEGRLVAALEFKSQIGSYGNNYNNRTEEAIGSAHCLWTAYREGALGDQPRPFLGWLMVVGDDAKSRSPVRASAPHFAVFPEWKDASYQRRYDLLCQKLVREQLYSAAALLTTPATAKDSGEYADLSQLSSLHTFVTALAGHIAAVAARHPPGRGTT